jgi:diguanylate cyclase (GGDEF)-like protein
MTNEYTGWQFLCWMTAHFLLALAAAEQCRQSSRLRTEPSSELFVRPVPRLPYAAVTVGYGVLLTVAVRLPMNPYGGVVLGAVALTSLVVARQLVALRENRQLAVTDYLTGLANRALLRYELTRALGRARRSNELIAVLLIDLNGFKQINDTLGHEAGDAMLVAFARMLEGQVRSSDLAARLGGDEFAVLISGNDPAGNAPIIADRIAAAGQRPIRIGDHELPLSASIGWALSGPDSTVEELLHRADVEMYRMKRAQSGAVRRTNRARLPIADQALVATPDGR